MSSSTKGVRILIFPFPAQGHMLPILDLTHQLALHGLDITILVTPKNLPTFKPLLSTHPSIQTLVFPFPHHPSIPSGVENVKDLGNSGNAPIIHALGQLEEPIIQWFKSHPTPPVAILSDFFLGWTQHLAHKIGIPRICFYSSGAFLTAVLEHLWLNFDSVHTLDVVDFPDLPKSPSFAMVHLPTVFRRYRKSDPDWEFVKDGMIANSSSWGFVINTFDALEAEYMEYSRKKMGRFFGVGPLSVMGGPDKSGRGDPKVDSTEYVFKWLDACPGGCVLYVCFGSQKLLNKAQMEALSSGLEQSGVRFIWVVKSATAQQMEDGYGLIPDGFEQRVVGRGLVIKGWAPQVSILSHRAVGGFLSHCGWNSTLEAIAAGVMLLTWPMEADQYVNARLLVEYIGAAVGVCEGVDTVPNSAELAKKFNESIHGEISEKIKAKQLREKAIEAVDMGGSSFNDLDGLVKELAQLQVTIA